MGTGLQTWPIRAVAMAPHGSLPIQVSIGKSASLIGLLVSCQSPRRGDSVAAPLAGPSRRRVSWQLRCGETLSVPNPNDPWRITACVVCFGRDSGAWGAQRAGRADDRGGRLFGN